MFVFDVSYNTQFIFLIDFRMNNMKQAVSGLNRYKIALSEGNTMCKLRFPECVSGQLAVAVSEDGSP